MSLASTPAAPIINAQTRQALLKAFPRCTTLMSTPLTCDREVCDRVGRRDTGRWARMPSTRDSHAAAPNTSAATWTVQQLSPSTKRKPGVLQRQAAIGLGPDEGSERPIGARDARMSSELLKRWALPTNSKGANFGA